MKTKEENLDFFDNPTERVKKNGTIEKKKKKKKGNFEVRVPRIIVRNLNFKVNEGQLKKAFEKCSTAITNVSIVSRDGQSKGFGFITFEKLEDAQKAIQTMNGQKVLGRPMAVDWSLPKNIYEKMHTKEIRAPVKNDSYGIQSHPAPPEIKEEEEEIQEDEDDDEDEDEEEKPKTRTEESSRDVREHRTLFIRNVPFDTTEEELSNALSSNSQRRVVSCRLVIDPVSRYPRGSAFVQFATTDDAEGCLNSSFTLRGQELQMDMALGRNELSKAKEIREQKKETTKKSDQRNLSLANHGVILNLSELDGNENELRKRQKLEDVKKQKLKDPLYFISPTRLTIHNLPPQIDDEKLRKIIIEYLKNDHIPTKDIVINECRVMKQTKEAKKSLGFGFVNLPRHEIALRVIALLNNNQHVFGPNRRPIVQFSVESRRALQLQEQRRERIHAKQELIKNPTNKTLSFDSNKKKKQKERNLFEPSNKKARLSEIIKQEEPNDENVMEINDDHQTKKPNIEKTNKKKKEKRPKTKSKTEIRDKLDRMIATTRNKPQLPQRTAKKWFE